MRDKIIIISVAVLAIVIGVLIFLSGGANTPDVSPALASNQTPAVVVPFTKLMQGTHSNVATRVNYVITSATQLTELWKTIGATGTPPTIDFTKQTVLAVFAGTASSSSIAIAKVEDTNARMVSISITSPEGACATKVATSPYELAVVPVTSLPLTHADIVTTTKCQN